MSQYAPHKRRVDSPSYITPPPISPASIVVGIELALPFGAVDKTALKK